MIIGQTIVAAVTGDTTTVYTPWIASWGNAAIFPYELMGIGGTSASFAVKVYTKNSEDADPGTQKGTTNTQTTAGTYSITDATALLELVRIQVTLTAGTGVAQAHFRVLNPSWKTN
jgi:hypothetical protein